MEKNNKLKLSEYVLACIDFEETQDEAKFNEIQSFLSKVECREYIPLKEKEMIMVNILSTVNQEYDAAGAAAFLELTTISKGLLAYCVNVDNDIALLHSLFHAYDLLHEFGLVDTIMKHCETDFARFTKMLNNTINFTNINKLTQTASLFDPEAYDQWERNMKELHTTLTKDGLQGLIAAVSGEEPAGKELLDTIQEIALEDVNREIASESSRLKKAIKHMETTQDIGDREIN